MKKCSLLKLSVDSVVGCSLKLFRSLARDCLATLPKGDKKAEIPELQPGIILFVMNIAIATGFYSHAVKLFDAANQVHCYSVNSLWTWEQPIGDPVQILN